METTPTRSNGENAARPEQPVKVESVRVAETVKVEEPEPAPRESLRSAPYWKTIPNIVVLAILLYIAIGTVCEISNRMEEHHRLVDHANFLRACIKTPTADGDECTKDTAPNELKAINAQLLEFDRLNTAGSVGDRCGVVAVITSPVPKFEDTCRTSNADSNNLDPRIKPILDPPFYSYGGWPLGLDERPREHLYFLLVIVSAGIGALLAGLRSAGFTTLRDLALGLGAGYAVYLLLRGGHFVFFTSGTNVDVLNPFTAGAASLLVGLYCERAFGMLSAAIAPPPERTI